MTAVSDFIRANQKDMTHAYAAVSDFINFALQGGKADDVQVFGMGDAGFMLPRITDANPERLLHFRQLPKGFEMNVLAGASAELTSSFNVLAAKRAKCFVLKTVKNGTTNMSAIDVNAVHDAAEKWMENQFPQQMNEVNRMVKKAFPFAKLRA